LTKSFTRPDSFSFLISSFSFSTRSLYDSGYFEIFVIVFHPFLKKLDRHMPWKSDWKALEITLLFFSVKPPDLYLKMRIIFK